MFLEAKVNSEHKKETVKTIKEESINVEFLLFVGNEHYSKFKFTLLLIGGEYSSSSDKK